MRIQSLIAVVLVLTLGFNAIPLTTNSQVDKENTKKWTFMVYMDADNSLYQYAPSDLKEMMSVGSNSSVNIVVLYDSAKEGDSAIYYIEKNKMEILNNLSEVDMGSPATLGFFLNWTMERFSSRYYFLDLWDHGNFYKGVCLDHGDWLTLRELRDAVIGAENHVKKRINVIGFDACREGIIETFYALRNTTDFVVASEKDEPASGWPYEKILEKIWDENPKRAAYNVVNSMYDWSREFFSKKGISTTMVAVNMSKFNNFIGIFNRNLKDILDVVPYYSYEIRKASYNSERYEIYYDMDLYNFMENLEKINDYKIDKFAENTMEGLTNISYYKVWNCPDPQNGVYANYSHGIGIYFPTFSVDQSYYSIDFAKYTCWVTFLNSVFFPNITKVEGSAAYELKNGILDIFYKSNVSRVELYITNNGELYKHSAFLSPYGNYTITLNYGEYKVYIYGYRNGKVVWVDNFDVNNTKIVKIEGAFYLNGKIANGASIILITENHRYFTVQNGTGFSFSLIYPSEINTTYFKIEVEYGTFHKIYSEHGDFLGNNNTVYLKIDENTEFYNSPLFLLPVLIAILILIVFLIRRRNRS